MDNISCWLKLTLACVLARFCFSQNAGICKKPGPKGEFVKIDNCTINGRNLTLTYSFNVTSISPPTTETKISFGDSEVCSSSFNKSLVSNAECIVNLHSASANQIRLLIIYNGWLQGTCRLMSDVGCIDLTPIIPTTSVTLTASSTGVFNLATNSTSVSSTESDNLGESSSVAIAVSLAAAAILIALLVMGLFIRKHRDKKEPYKKDVQFKPLEDSRSSIIHPKRMKLFLIFINDHPKHLNVVKSFIDFLQIDLGFHVTCELFETEEIAQDPVHWMHKQFHDSDKIVVIWSPKAAERWNKYGQDENHRQDRFTPVLKQIRNALFYDQNRVKYYFGYFDYFSKEDIPPEFRNEKSFQLMRDFEELYYRLNSIEQYREEGVIKQEKAMFDHYNDPAVNKFGPKLHKSIHEMMIFIEDNPNWYSLPLPHASLPNLKLDEEIADFVLDIQPPSPIPSVALESNVFDGGIPIDDSPLPNSTKLEDETNSITVDIQPLSTVPLVAEYDLLPNKIPTPKFQVVSLNSEYLVSDVSQTAATENMLHYHKGSQNNCYDFKAHVPLQSSFNSKVLISDSPNMSEVPGSSEDFNSKLLISSDSANTTRISRPNPKIVDENYCKTNPKLSTAEHKRVPIKDDRSIQSQRNFNDKIKADCFLSSDFYSISSAKLDPSAALPMSPDDRIVTPVNHSKPRNSASSMQNGFNNRRTPIELADLSNNFLPAAVESPSTSSNSFINKTTNKNEQLGRDSPTNSGCDSGYISDRQGNEEQPKAMYALSKILPPIVALDMNKSAYGPENQRFSGELAGTSRNETPQKPPNEFILAAPIDLQSDPMLALQELNSFVNV